jgi:tight adherence protein B
MESNHAGCRIMMTATVMLLVAVFCLSVIVLKLDARQKRVDRQVASALSLKDQPDDFASQSVQLQRQVAGSKVLRILLNYERDAPHNWRVSRMVAIGLGVVLTVTTLGCLLVPLWLAVIAGTVSGCVAVRGIFGWQRHRYANRLLRQLPDAIELVISVIRAGLPIAEAFHSLVREMPTPTRDQFALVAHEMALGRPPEEALRSVYDRTHVAEYAMFSVTLAVQNKSGGRLAETLQILGDTVRQRVTLAGRAMALAGEAKLSARVLASIPFIAGLGLYIERPESLDPLFHDPRGHILFAFGLTTLALGILTMRRMIRKGTTV